MRKRISPQLSRLEPRRVCLVKPSALGDIVQTLPVLGALRRRWPRAYLAWVVNDNLAGILDAHPDLDEVIPFYRNARGARWWKGAAELAARLSRRRFDLVCDLQGLLRSGLMTLATRAPRRVGLSTAREGAHLCYTDHVPVPTLDMPAVDRYWLMAEALGTGDCERRFHVAISETDRQWAWERLRRLARPVIAIHPGARWETKRWPPQSFAEIVHRARQHFGASVVTVGTTPERSAANEVLAGPREGCLNLAGETSLKQLAAVLAEADVMLAGDSGPMHLAAAVGTPVVAVFTCTSPLRAGPYGSGHRVVATGVWCAASYLKMCDRMECMRELTPERVWPAVADALAEKTTLSQSRSSA